MAERIQKVLARVGLGSRRRIEEWIRAGRIAVNGETAELGQRLEATDRLSLDGKPLQLDAPGERQLLIYNKPEGEVCSRVGTGDCPTVFAALPEPGSGKWLSIGRLDINSSGLLAFTNDGELVNRFAHPRAGFERKYLVRVSGEMDADKHARLLAGVELEDGPARFTALEIRGSGAGINRWYQVGLTEGRNREVRRLFEAVDCRVGRLKRIAFGPLQLPPGLRRGQWTRLSPQAVDELARSLGLTVRERTPSRGRSAGPQRRRR